MQTYDYDSLPRYLGSSRLLTSAYGMPVWQTTYLPFGEEHQQQPTPNNYKFTGKERDSSAPPCLRGEDRRPRFFS